MGSAVGVMKVAAKRIGIPPAEYEARLAVGERWCTRDKVWHPLGEFGADANRADGIARSCLASRRQRLAETYTPKARPPTGRRYVGARDGDSLQARRRVNYLVDAMLLPRPNTLPCVDCGHEWSDGERRHEYDHYLGYSPIHHEDVEPTCTTCHHNREIIRRKALA